MKAHFRRFGSDSRPPRHLSAMRTTCLAVLVAVAACGDDVDPVDATTADAMVVDGAAPHADATLDALTDGATGPDGATDATVPDGTADAGLDALADAGPDASPDAPVDAVPDAPVDAVTDAPVDAPADAPIDAAVPDAPVDANPDAPIVTEVETSDGFTEVRQGSTVTLVIAGDRLVDATSVIVGAIVAPIVTRAGTELTVTLTVPHGHAAGPLAVTVTTTDGIATAPDAVTITHFIVAPTAAPGGRGTYQSPITICDPTLTSSAAGDTFELLAGEHRCDEYRFLRGGFRMIGAGAAQTVVDTAGWEIIDASGETLIADLRLRRGTLWVYDGAPRPYAFRDIEAEVMLLEATHATAAFERVNVVGAPLVSISSFPRVGDGFPSVTATDVTVTGPGDLGTAIHIGEGSASLTRVTIRGFSTGAAVTARLTGQPCPHTITLIDSHIIDAAIGIDILCGNAQLVRSTITDDPVTAPATTLGIDVEHGRVEVRDGSHIEATAIGVQTSLRTCQGPFESSSRVTAADSTIIGGEIGISYRTCDAGSITLRRSVIRGGNTGVRIGCSEPRTCAFDLSGGNDLQVTSPTGVALYDVRSDVGVFLDPINFVGSTLNGRSYAGQLVSGPAEMVPDYAIYDDGMIQF